MGKHKKGRQPKAHKLTGKVEGNSMQLLKFRDEIVQVQNFDGLINVEFKYKVQSASANITWMGPKIPPEEWEQMLSFFKWTNSEHRSESQVRLFVNHKLGTWKIWAFPQEARTSMSAREISGSEFDKQRAEFKDDEGWIYFGTVHHHCNCGAFQSGTDAENERNQDGLHITVGYMDKEIHDLHCRFTLAGSMFEPNLSWFWDIGDHIRAMTPEGVHDLIARHQMSRTASRDFPVKWKENVIEVKGGPPYGGTFWHGGSYAGGYGVNQRISTPIHISSGNGASQQPGAGEYNAQASGALAEKGVAKIVSPSNSTCRPEALTMLRSNRAERAVLDLNRAGHSDEEIAAGIEAGSMTPVLFNCLMSACLDWNVEVEDVCREAKWCVGRANFRKQNSIDNPGTNQMMMSDEEFSQQQLYGVD